MKILFRTIIFGCVIALAACGSDECSREISYPDISGSQIYKQDSIALRNYLVERNWPINITESGIYHYTETEGQGEFPELCDAVNVDYQGYYLNGDTFDQNEDRSFPLTGVIKGWQEGCNCSEEMKQAGCSYHHTWLMASVVQHLSQEIHLSSSRLP